MIPDPTEEEYEEIRRVILRLKGFSQKEIRMIYREQGLYDDNRIAFDYIEFIINNRTPRTFNLFEFEEQKER